MEVVNVQVGSTREINAAIRNATNHNKQDEVYVRNASGLSNIAVGIRENARIIIGGDVGDLIGALNDGATVQVDGHAGKYAGDGMTAGEVIINGDAGDGAGTAMCGGILVIKGNATNHVGQLLKGGMIIVGGNVRHHAGSFMIAGTIIIGGDAGRELGTSMIGGRIYIRGNHETLSANLQRTQLNEEDVSFLEKLFVEYQLDMNAEQFSKIVTRPKTMMLGNAA